MVADSKLEILFVARECLEPKRSGAFEGISHHAELGVGIHMGQLSWLLIGGSLRELQPLMMCASNDPLESHLLVARWVVLLRWTMWIKVVFI